MVHQNRWTIVPVQRFWGREKQVQRFLVQRFFGRPVGRPFFFEILGSKIRGSWMKTATQEVISRKKVSSRTLEKSYFCIKCFYNRKISCLKPWYHILKPLNPFSKTMVPYFSNRWTLFQKTMVPYFRTVELFSRTMVPYSETVDLLLRTWYHILKPLNCFLEPWYHIFEPLNCFLEPWYHILKPLNYFWPSYSQTVELLLRITKALNSFLLYWELWPYFEFFRLLRCSNLKGI